MLGMQPVARESLPVCALALRDFVFVIGNAGRFHQCGYPNLPRYFIPLLNTQCAIRAPGQAEFPEMFSRFRRFPQRKSARSLFRIDRYRRRARLNASQIDLRELAVRGNFPIR